jgi:hypothetical protein
VFDELRLSQQGKVLVLELVQLLPEVLVLAHVHHLLCLHDKQIVDVRVVGVRREQDAVEFRQGTRWYGLRESSKLKQ